MQALNLYNDNLFVSDNFKCVEINKSSLNVLQDKKFKYGLQNALHLLSSLESSLRKSSKYEEKLMKCRKSHSHSHTTVNSWTSDSDKEIMKDKYCHAERPELSKNINNLTESWSTMSMVCLQYQYEELSKKYGSLLQSYDDICNTLKYQEEKLLMLKKRIKEKYAEVADMNMTIITVGEKYLSLKEKKDSQKIWYEEKIKRLKIAIRAILYAIQQARHELN